MSEIIITADLGTMNIYEVVRDPLKIASDRLEKIKSRVADEPRMKASEKFTAAAGRFYQGGGTDGTIAGFGEPHNVVKETEKRLIKRIAEDINVLIGEKGCDKWYLAAERRINNQILELLAPDVKTKLRKSVAANLTKTDKSKIMCYFD